MNVYPESTVGLPWQLTACVWLWLNNGLARLSVGMVSSYNG